MKNLFKGLLAVALLLMVTPTFAVEAAHAGSTVLTPAPDNGILGVLQEAGKSQIVAAVLAWFLGAFGIHFYYLGYKDKGKKRLFLGMIGLGLEVIGGILFFVPVVGLLMITVGSIVLFIAWILGVIEMVKILNGDLKPADGEYTDTI